TFSTLHVFLDLDFAKFKMVMTLDPSSHFPGDSLNVPSGQTAKLRGGVVGQRVTIRGKLQVLNAFGQSTGLVGDSVKIYGGGVPAPALEARGDVVVGGKLAIASGGILDITSPGYDIKFQVNSAFTNNGQIILSSSTASSTPTL